MDPLGPDKYLFITLEFWIIHSAFPSVSTFNRGMFAEKKIFVGVLVLSPEELPHYPATS